MGGRAYALPQCRHITQTPRGSHAERKCHRGSSLSGKTSRGSARWQTLVFAHRMTRRPLVTQQCSVRRGKHSVNSVNQRAVEEESISWQR
jgi:hypothetical protein